MEDYIEKSTDPFAKGYLPPVALFVQVFRRTAQYFDDFQGGNVDIFKQKIDTELIKILDETNFDEDAIQYDFYLEKYNVTTRELCEYMVFC